MQQKDILSLRTIDLSSEYTEKKATEKYEFELSVCSLLAGIAHLDGWLLPSKFQLYRNAVMNLFGKKIKDDVMLRVEILKIFINPPKIQDTSIKLINLINKLHVTLRTREIVIDYALKVIKENNKNRSRAIKILKKITEDLNITNSVLLLEIESIESLINEEEKMVFENENKLESIKNDSPLNWEEKQFLHNKHYNFGLKSIKTSREIENMKSKDFIRKTKMLATLINSDNLSQRVIEFHKQIEPNPYKVVLTGEIKHGKSTIFNRIVGKNLSPIGEATATTAVVVEMYYSDEPNYEAWWMNSDTLDNILRFTSDNNDSNHVKKYVKRIQEIVNSGGYKPGEKITAISSLLDVKDYITAHGDYAYLVEKARFGLPLECLRHGITIVDTPGINDPIKVRDHITLEQAKYADCIVFVMRADKFGTESERIFLYNLMEKGKATNLIICLTHIDRLSSDNERARVLKEVENWVRMVSPRTENDNLMKKIKIFAFDPRNTSDNKTVSHEQTDDFNLFFNELSSLALNSKRDSNYIDWITSKRNFLLELSREESETFLHKSNEQFMNNQTLELMENLSNRFFELSQSNYQQIQSRLKSIKELIVRDHSRAKEDIDRTKKEIIEAIRSAIETRVRELGKDYAGKEKWDSFNRTTAALLVQKYVYEMDNRLNNDFEYWKNRTEELFDEVDLIVKSSLDSYKGIQKDYNDLCNISHTKTVVLCKVDSTLNGTGKFLSYGTAYIIGGGVTAIIKLIGTASTIAFPPAGIIIVSAVVAGGFIAKLVSKPEKQKHDYIEKMVKEAETNINKRFEMYEEKIKEAYLSLWDYITQSVEVRYRELAENIYADSSEAKLQVEISKRIRNDLFMFVQGQTGLSFQEKNVNSINNSIRFDDGKEQENKINFEVEECNINETVAFAENETVTGKNKLDENTNVSEDYNDRDKLNNMNIIAETKKLGVTKALAATKGVGTLLSSLGNNIDGKVSSILQDKGIKEKIKNIRGNNN
ncbi:hypothetical protein F9B85_10745 [Heliorestis acidaminivorans]|uniref:Dynamin N-terminal domain-containing protein n=1 Tax=Heliorestis acidaminivorans TaxID=553427 RepID=A0A6I0EYY7_9FIRM|nr:dynamin family protein [Heliorestis acidaminivorans]KAB2952022.1 hypothetical protein F9B85_10745 [Heliorestis acidaminivorans]